MAKSRRLIKPHAKPAVVKRANKLLAGYVPSTEPAEPLDARVLRRLDHMIDLLGGGPRDAAPLMAFLADPPHDTPTRGGIQGVMKISDDFVSIENVFIDNLLELDLLLNRLSNAAYDFGANKNSGLEPKPENPAPPPHSVNARFRLHVTTLCRHVSQLRALVNGMEDILGRESAPGISASIR